jgi:hypothetical protein
MSLQKIDHDNVYQYDYEMDFEGNIELLLVTREEDNEVITIWDKNDSPMPWHREIKEYHVIMLLDLIADEMDQLC